MLAKSDDNQAKPPPPARFCSSPLPPPPVFFSFFSIAHLFLPSLRLLFSLCSIRRRTVQDRRPAGRPRLRESRRGRGHLGGGILLPSAAQVKSTQGVIAAAPKGGAKTLSEGDRVLYSKYAGTEIKMGKDEFVLLKVRTWFGGVGERREGGE